MIKFLHTADWQIGKSFAYIDKDQEVFLRTQRIETVRKIGKIASDNKVDFVLVAGDVFDSNLVEFKTLRQTFSAMADTFQGKWFLLPGNHDSAETISVWTTLRQNCSSENIIILDKPKPYLFKDLNCVILPAPLQRRHDMRDLTEWFDDYKSEPGVIRLGIAHGSMSNRLQVRGEAPNNIADTRADTARLDYLALGDWHGTMEIGPRTYYSGTPETDRFRDNDPGNVLIVKIAESGAKPEVETLRSGHYLWLQHDQNIFAADDIESVRNMLNATGESLNKILLRLKLTGTVNLENRALIKSELDKLEADLFYINLDDQALLAEPTADDLDEIDRSGFVRHAVNELVTMAKDEANPEKDAARLALQILYLEHKKLEEQKC